MVERADADALGYSPGKKADTTTLRRIAWLAIDNGDDSLSDRGLEELDPDGTHFAIAMASFENDRKVMTTWALALVGRDDRALAQITVPVPEFLCLEIVRIAKGTGAAMEDAARAFVRDSAAQSKLEGYARWKLAFRKQLEQGEYGRGAEAS
jgi:hypothetical protein